jgi:WD40 repeat protein
MIVKKIDTFSGHRDCVYDLEASAKSGQFYSAAGDGMIVRWDLSRPDFGELIARVPASVYAIARDPVRDQLWLGQNYEGIQVIDPATKQIVQSSSVTKAAIFDIQFFKNHAFVALSDGIVVVMDVENFAVRKHLKASDQSARCVAVSAQTNEIAVGYSDYNIRIFDADTLDLKHTIAAHDNSVFTLQYSPNGKWLLSGSRDARLKAWSVLQNYELAHTVVAHLFAINHLIFSPDARIFATCSMDKSIKIWDTETLRLLKVIDRARHAGHGTSVNKLLWDTTTQRLLSASDDRMISVWEIS